MEYRERYYFEWRAQMRDRLGYTLRILERGYKGEAEQLYPTGEVMRIVQGAQDDDELAAIKPSELRLSLLCLDSGEPYANLFTLDPLRYRVEVGVERADAAGELRPMILWRGYLSYAEYQQPYANPPYRVELVANDGLAVLKTIPFAEDDGSAYSWRESIVQIIDRCLSHIDGSAAVWPIEPVEAEQAQNTFDLIGLDASAIYAAFDNATPTCYEVLDSILRNFGCQLFQSYGRWEVRRIYSLSDYARPANYQSITDGFGLTRNAVSKLYGEQGEPEGLSSSAVLSILPPLRAVAIDRRNDEYSTKIVAAADAKRWKGVLTNSPYSAVYSRGERVVLGFDYRHVDGGWAFALDTVVQSANSVELNLSLDIYNRQSLDATLRLGLFLVPAADDPIEWLRRVSIKDTIAGDVNQITVESLVSGYVFETEEWETLPEGTYTCDDVLTPRTIEVTLAPSTRTFYPWLNVAPTALSMQTATITVKAVPNLATKMRPVVLVWWRGDGARPSIDVANMEVSVSLTAGTALPEQGRSEEAISPSGIEDIAYSQLYTDTYDLPISDAMFTPALVEVGDGEPIHGFVAPSLNSQLSDIVSRQLRQLRRGTTRQLDGEVYVHEPIDMNTLWRDRDGRIYYTNYIEHKLHRGVYSVQLREMLPLSEVLTQTPIDRPMTEVVSLDTSAVYLDGVRRTLYRYDFVTGASAVLRESLYPMYLRRGYDAVSVVEVVAEGEEYNLYAYGDSGELLSEVRNVLRVESNNVSASETDSYARSALYNARGEWWMLAGNLTSSPKPPAVISVISRDAQIIYEDGRGFGGRVIDSALTLNGFMLDVDYADEGTSRVLFHDMAIHDESEYSTRALGHTIVAITDKLVVVQSEAEDLYKVCLVNGARAELNTDYPLFSQRATSAKFADMNNALVLFRYDGGGGILYDARTGDSTVFTAAEIPALASVWLSSEYICVAEGYTVTRRRVVIGAELADAAALITADGAVFTTVDGRVFMPMAATATTASNGVGTAVEAYHSRHTGEEIDDAVSAVRNKLIPEQERVSAIATNAYDIATGLRVDVWGDAENKGLTDRIAEAEGGLTLQGTRIEKVEKDTADNKAAIDDLFNESGYQSVSGYQSEYDQLVAEVAVYDAQYPSGSIRFKELTDYLIAWSKYEPELKRIIDSGVKRPKPTVAFTVARQAFYKARTALMTYLTKQSKTNAEAIDKVASRRAEYINERERIITEMQSEDEEFVATKAKFLQLADVEEVFVDSEGKVLVVRDADTAYDAYRAAAAKYVIELNTMIATEGDAAESGALTSSRTTYYRQLGILNGELSAVRSDIYKVANGLKVDVWGDAENKGLKDRIAEAEGGLKSQGTRISGLEGRAKTERRTSVLTANKAWNGCRESGVIANERKIIEAEQSDISDAYTIQTSTYISYYTSFRLYRDSLYALENSSDEVCPNSDFFDKQDDFYSKRAAVLLEMLAREEEATTAIENE